METAQMHNSHGHSGMSRRIKLTLSLFRRSNSKTSNWWPNSWTRKSRSMA